jgi:diadenosine tetraphosphate (Ap4A) HIT family hydrolase
MDKHCDACGFLKNPSPKTQILDTPYWSVGIDGRNHAYLGRAYVTLKEHKGSLSSLSQQEWADFQEIVKRLEKAYKDAFGAEPLNWGCFMNHAFREKPFNSHVHWHIYPRYEVAPVLDGITFDDPLFGEFYDVNAERPVGIETVEHIASALRQHIA